MPDFNLLFGGDAVATGRGVIEKERYLLLDGLRGVAAISVLLFHTGWQTGLEDSVFPHGYLAVDFFFLLSGFIVSDAYDRRLSDARMSFKQFVTARVIRLYPMVLLASLVGFAIYAAMWPPVDAGSVEHLSLLLLANMFLVPLSMATATAFGFPLNSPMWSLFWEIVANLVYAVGARRLAARTWIGVALVFLAVILWYARYHNGLSRGATEWMGGFVRVGFSFFVGVLIWHMRSRLPAVRLPALPFVLVLIAILAAPVPDHVNMLIDVFAVVLLFPVLVALASRAPVGDRWVASCGWLGAISYPLYALHYPFMEPIKRLNAHLAFHGMSSLALTVVAGCLICLFAHLVLVHFDEPLRSRLRQFTGRAAPVRGESAP